MSLSPYVSLILPPLLMATPLAQILCWVLGPSEDQTLPLKGLQERGLGLDGAIDPPLVLGGASLVSGQQEGQLGKSSQCS